MICLKFLYLFGHLVEADGLSVLTLHLNYLSLLDADKLSFFQLLEITRMLLYNIFQQVYGNFEVSNDLSQIWLFL